MADANLAHNRLQMNTCCAIANALETEESDYEVLGSSQCIFVQNDLYYFADLLVVHKEMQVSSFNALHNPAAIVEILSPTTATDDRTDKFREYQQIPTLRHYVLIDQNRVAVTHFERTESGLWVIPGDYRELSDILSLTLGKTTVEVPLAQIYRRVIPTR